MKQYFLVLLLLAPSVLIAQGSFTLRQGSIHITSGHTYPSAGERLTFREQQFQRFPVDWADDIVPGYALYAPPSFSSTKLSLGFDWTTRNDSKFSRWVDIGISTTALRGIAHQREYHEVLKRYEDHTSLGLFRYDSVLIHQQQITQESHLVGLDAQIRYFTKKDHWLKGYAGLKLFAGVSFDAYTQVLAITGQYDKYYLADQPLHNQPPFFAFENFASRRYPDPTFFVGRVSLPVGMEARLWQAANKKGAFSFFIEGEFGGEYMSGTYRGVRPLAGVSAGIRYRFR